MADKRKTSRFLTPAFAVLAAGMLLLLAMRQQDAYYAELAKQFPGLTDPDYAYSPPARLLAFLIVGPGVLIPYGFTSAALPNGSFLPMSLSAVFLFWLFLLWIRDIRRGNRTVVCIVSIACIASASATVLSAERLREDFRALNWPMLLAAIKHYGIACVLWIDCVALVWLLSLTVWLSFEVAKSCSFTTNGFALK